MNKINIEGLFEIHISVEPTQICKLRLFCMKENMKPIFACSNYGNNKNQLMISKWKNGTYEEIFNKTNEIIKKMKDFNIVIERIKIESMQSNKGVPLEYNNLYIDRQYYFEFHIKYIIKDFEEYKLLEDCAQKYSGSVSFNAFKEILKPLVTLRISGKYGLNKAIEIKNNFIKKLKENNFHSNCEIQREFCVYDTNIEYDDGWLETIN